MQTDNFTYSEFQKEEKKIEDKFGGSRGLQLRNLDMSILRSSRLLNFGCGHTSFPELCTRGEVRVDSDKEVSPDFISLEHIPENEKFSSVYANQVFEHIRREEIFNVVCEISKRMSVGAKILATIPNINNWSQYINNLDHKTPLPFYSLGAFFELAEIEIVDSYRYTKRPNEIIQASEQEKYLFVTSLYNRDA